MRMLKLLRLAVCVVCIAAFASGCGGGGGGTATPEEPPVVVDPGPSDEQRIADAREAIAGIVTEATTIEQAARSAVTAVESNPDATVEQIADARAEGNAALDALRAIIRASGAANAATTPAAAEGAEASARAALSTLRSAQSAAAAIQSRVEAVGNLREQEAEEDRLATNGSSLIQHVRENKLVYDAALASIGAAAINHVAAVETNDNKAEYPAYSTTAGSPTYAYPLYPRPSSNVEETESGVRKVYVNTLDSDNTTPKLSGTSTLPNGFDLKSGTTFVNAYTDIKIAGRARTEIAENVPNTPQDERYTYQEDADYLLTGIWLTSTNELHAFAYGSQLIDSTGFGCTGDDKVDTGTTTRNCTDAANFQTVTNFVDADKSFTANYQGDANGAYLADGKMSYFEADVSLTAEFVNDGGTTGSGNISGAVTNIVAGGKSIAGSIDLKKDTFMDDISGELDGAAAGVIAGDAYTGAWKGRFFGKRVTKRSDSVTADNATTVTTTYSAEAPGSVAGTFYVNKQTAGSGAALIGSFGAHR